MLFFRMLVVSVLLLPSLVQAYHLDLEGYLSDGFTEQRYEIRVDGKLIGEIHPTTAKPNAKLSLELSKQSHQYAIVGEGVTVGGDKVNFTGGGVIVTADHLDALMDNKKSGAEVVAGYQALLEEITAAVPSVDVSDLEIQFGEKVSAKSIADAEKRLKLKLPEDYKVLVQKMGSLQLGVKDKSAVFAPDELLSVVDYYAKEVDLVKDKDRQIIAKRFRHSSRDIVLDYFYLDEYSVLQAKHQCPKSEYGFLFPGYDIGLLSAAINIDDNPWFALIDYYDDIMGEPVCANYTTVLGWGLIDFIVYNGSHVLFQANGNDEQGPQKVYLTGNPYRSTDAEILIEFEK